VEIYSWCILPNHYHLLVKTAVMKLLRKELGLFHGRTSFEWNREDDARGRQVWHNCFERKMRSERHFYATVNYVLNMQFIMAMWKNGRIGSGLMRRIT